MAAFSREHRRKSTLSAPDQRLCRAHTSNWARNDSSDPVPSNLPGFIGSLLVSLCVPGDGSLGRLRRCTSGAVSLELGSETFVRAEDRSPGSLSSTKDTPRD